MESKRKAWKKREKLRSVKRVKYKKKIRERGTEFLNER